MTAIAVVACGDPAIDDAGLHQDLTSNRAGAEVYFHAHLLADPVRSGSHEDVEVSDQAGDHLQVDHNLDLAPWVPMHAGDVAVVRGQLYIDSPTDAGVHCTHAQTSTGCPYPGWIDFKGTRYS